MYAANFDYYRARSIDDARQLMAAHPGAKLLAGGHSLVPLMKLRLAAPPAVVDIGRIAEMHGIARQGAHIRIGALTTHAQLAASADLRASAPALADAAGLVGDPAVRNRGTIGGNVAHADPASDLPTVLAVLDAQFVLVGPGGTRTVAAGQFFTGLMSTALAEDEILVEVQVPADDRNRASAYEKFAHPASRYAVLGAAAAVTVTRGAFDSARVTVGGLVPCARRATAVERALAGKPANADTIAEAARQATADLGADVTGDLYASAEYRAAMAPGFIRRAVTAAAARAAAA
jgi:carbon-monoxide dehydrogenase medium subunit